MHEPAAIWGSRLIVFDKDVGLAQNVILSQAAEALSAVIERIGTLRKLVEASPIKNAYLAPEIPSLLSDLCYQAGLASTILFNDSSQGSKESDSAYELRRKRVHYVMHWCGTQKLQTPVLRDRGLRNALTHVDEHLADAMTREAGVGWFIDAAISSRTEFVAPQGVRIAFCRSYISSEDKIIHLGHEVSLSDLANECAALLKVVFGRLPRAT